MPSRNQIPYAEQIYEAMRDGKEVPFEFTTGGVKYRAVFQHKEARDARRSSLSRSNTDDSAFPSSGSPPIQPKSLVKDSKH